jgi:Magnesium transporter NIPA
VLAHCVLDEKLHKPGWIGCILCIVGSAIIALHAPKEREIESVKQIWHYATQPGNFKQYLQCEFSSYCEFGFYVSGPNSPNASGPVSILHRFI